MGKTDRSMRVVRVMQIMSQATDGISPKEIAQKCGVDVRTTYRDLIALENELGVPVWEHRGKRGIEPGYMLVPVTFTLPEVMNIFLAARLMARHKQRYDPNMATTFTKLKTAIQSPLLKDQIEKTTRWLDRQRQDDRHLFVMATLSKCWVKQRTARIKYRRLGGSQVSERSIDPYFIEPGAEDHASYVIAYCHQKQRVRTFKVERILDIEMTESPYEIPGDFDATKFLDHSWGIYTGGQPQKVRLQFAPEIARLFEEVLWHQTQRIERQMDGSVIMEVRVLINVEFTSWVLSWGANVRVLEPESLREEIRDTARAILRVYGEPEDL